jgi:hypothetical protein
LQFFISNIKDVHVLGNFFEEVMVKIKDISEKYRSEIEEIILPQIY